jgi:hypothetical protein
MTRFFNMSKSKVKTFVKTKIHTKPAMSEAPMKPGLFGVHCKALLVKFGFQRATNY